MIKLIKDPIDRGDIDALKYWLDTEPIPQLSKGEITKQFEKKWSEFFGVKYSIFVNSGSSANLVATYALKLLKKYKNNKVIVPALSWSTSLSPFLQLRDFQPVLCDCDRETLGIDLNHFEDICKKENPSAILLVHVLGVPNKMKEIKYLCDKYNVLIQEDACESISSKYDDKKLGTFGILGTFSTYISHVMSSVEGGFVCTNDKEIYNVLLSIRNHGMIRDIEKDVLQEIKNENNISDFYELYSFNYPGFNVRATEIQAFLGLRQLQKLDYFVNKREENFQLYNKLIKNDFWKIKPTDNSFVSNLAYPVITLNIKQLIDNLYKNNIECRPLITGNLGRQMFYKDLFGECRLPMVDLVHDYGLYLPNNHEMTKEEIEFICKVVNEAINE